jgi:EpsI family protein
VSTKPVLRIVVLAALLLATSLYLSRAMVAEAPPARSSLARFPMALEGWQGRGEAEFSDRILTVLGVDDYILRSYRRGSGPSVGFYVGYYDSQRQGDTMHSPLNCLPGAGWTPLDTSRLKISVSTTTVPIEVKRVIIQKGLDRQLVLYWYQSHGRVIASEYWGKIYTVVDAVTMNRTDAALVRVITSMPDASPEADRAAQDLAVAFVQTAFPRLSSYIPN